jgi:hypothetical protein
MNVYQSRRPKFRLPRRDIRPLKDPILFPKFEVTMEVPEVLAAGIPVPTFTNESCGDPADIESLFAESPGPDEMACIP